LSESLSKLILKLESKLGTKEDYGRMEVK